VVVALHDLSLAAQFCTAVVLLDGGHTIATGPPHDVLTEHLPASVYGVARGWRAWTGCRLSFNKRFCDDAGAKCSGAPASGERRR
jgi:ABC-type cobalamin/Fe3+-siderophores transport system ATPase subunit